MFVFPANKGTNVTLQTLTSNTASPVATFAETDSGLHTRYAPFRVSGYDGFYVALQSLDTCVQVHRLQVLYWTCPGGVQGLAEVDGSAEPMGSRSFRCNVNSTQVVEGTHLTCLVEQSGEDEYTEWKLLGDAAMGITEVCQCDPGFQLLMTRTKLAVCGGVLCIRQMFCMPTSGAWYICGKYRAVVGTQMNCSNQLISFVN